MPKVLELVDGTIGETTLAAAAARPYAGNYAPLARARHTRIAHRRFHHAQNAWSPKIIRDVLSRKGRTLLVALSIMIGVFGAVTLISLVKRPDSSASSKAISIPTKSPYARLSDRAFGGH